VADELYAIDEENNTLLTMRGSMGTLEADFDWKAEFGLGGIEYAPADGGMARMDQMGSQYMSRFDIRMYMDENARANLWIQYDDGKWEHMGEIKGKRLKTFVLPIIPKRCDHLRFKLTGRGLIRVFSINRIMEVGGDGGAY
jgi:hypothetical protein